MGRQKISYRGFSGRRIGGFGNDQVQSDGLSTNTILAYVEFVFTLLRNVAVATTPAPVQLICCYALPAKDINCRARATGESMRHVNANHARDAQGLPSPREAMPDRYEVQGRYRVFKPETS